jgi:hypothetical protein
MGHGKSDCHGAQETHQFICAWDRSPKKAQYHVSTGQDHHDDDSRTGNPVKQPCQLIADSFQKAHG